MSYKYCCDINIDKDTQEVQIIQQLSTPYNINWTIYWT